MLPLIPVLSFFGGILFTGAVVATVIYLNKKELKEILNDKNAEAFSAKIKAMRKDGAYTNVDIGLYDKDSNELEDITIQAEDLNSDIKNGLTLLLQ